MQADMTLDVFPVNEELLSAKEFIDLVEKSPWLIERSRIVPPRLGSKGMGSIQVHYTRPLYKSLPAFKPVHR